MTLPRELSAADLYRSCESERFDFSSTADVAPLEEALGQPRAVAALDLGISMDRYGYNLFLVGPAGTGRHRLALERLRERASRKPPPSDWCYVYNFEDPRRPAVLRLEAGQGTAFRREMEHLVEELRTALAAALEGDEYQTRRHMIEEEFGERQSALFEGVGKSAESRGLRMLQSPAGILFVPTRNGQLVKAEDLEQQTPEAKAKLEKDVGELQEELQKALRQIPRWQRERHEAIRELNREVTRFAVGTLIEDLRGRHSNSTQIREYLDAVERDVIEHARAFVGRPEESLGEPNIGPLPEPIAKTDGDHPFLRRYRVNIIVDNGGTTGAPVVVEDHPTHATLIGRVEHIAQFGALVTDFNLIRAGALHRANGGYLVLDAREVLRQPYAWEELKRALRAGRIKIESLGESLGLVHTVSLEPESVPLDVKVVLVGEPYVHFLVSTYDPEFPELFRIYADFDDRVVRSADSEYEMARLIAKIVADESLLPFDRGAVARVVEQSARFTEDRERLSLDIGRIRDLLCEADHFAKEAGDAQVGRDHVEKAIAERVYRSDRMRERVQEEIHRGIVDIATDGEAVGQINALSILQLADFRFGRPSRVTARVRLGSGQVVNIEREVELSGPIHSKGVLILSGFLGERYATDTPLSLNASLVFEQSYGGIDGDSASSTELYALLSAIGGVPIRQSLAVTGAVDQHGNIRAVGGVNEKIEGFFDVCDARGLDGAQGVAIPASNVPHLMLRRDVVEAVGAGRFHIYAVETVDQGMELLTGLPSGIRAEDGSFPEDSWNGRVVRRLAEMAQRRVEFGKEATGAEKETP